MSNNTTIHYLVASRWKTPDGTILWSKHRLDYVYHVDALTGEYYSLDGGNDYCRISGNYKDLTNLSVYNTDPIEKIREVFSWGSYGKNQDEELHHILLKDLTLEHINAILRTQIRLATWIKEMFKQELEYRKSHNLI